ncbi:ankyrin repeat domain-containing protein [Novosphingobium mangrovi (ex Huang et al. 2023)]|uniref:Ankyrin repeat domain-containing protein n=1 Tax=Novosphingobium mangrovi (ex Huang et al. 2023) TaxID=2976432 RepID=A0ABT2I5R5_9SPHN|nr:ankyrin repeat domain-containing protein [Novosphingobium mangrovi (ex Huang et al. 2023)]MCT2400148.1 ankyrin repeat domain-containing protein [Novosphingobium mangrovi (ex Huang et al. 2023)]
MNVKLLAASVLCFASLGTAGCAQREDRGDGAAGDVPVAQCGDARADPARLAAIRESDAELVKALHDHGDPVAEAQKALDAGDYRLAAATTPDRISTELYGAQCRILGGLKPWDVRALAFVPDEAAAMGRGPDDKVTDFGRRYNAAILGDARYPYADICRDLDRAGPEPDFSEAGTKGIEQPYGFAELGPARMAYGLGAAARRGSVYDIRVLINRDKQDVDAPDMFGMTPLAWAIAYHRWPAAEALLKAKASPTGGACQTAIDRESPLQVARIMRWSAMIRRLRPLVTEEEFANLRQKPRWDDQSLTEFNHALTELKQRYEKVLRRSSFARHDLLFEVDDKGNSTSCSLEPASNSPEFDKELCDLAIEIVHWAPARDAFGVTVPESAKLVVGFGGT